MIQISTVEKFFFKKNSKYLFLVAVLVLAFFSSQFLPKVDKIKKSKSIIYQPAWQGRSPDITKENPEKVFKEVIHSAAGDFYRIGFLAKSLTNDRIYFKVVSKAGKEQEIGAFDLSQHNEEKYFEMTFSTNGIYRDIVAYKKKDDIPSGMGSISMDNEGIYVSNFSASRLEVRNQFELEALQQTIVGETQINKIYLPDNSDGAIEDTLAEEDFFAGYFFEAKSDYLASVEMNLSAVGSNDANHYELRIVPEDAWNMLIDTHKSLSYFANDRTDNEIEDENTMIRQLPMQDLNALLTKDGNQKFDLSMRLEKGKRYFVGVVNTTQKIDKNNYLRLNKLKNNKGDFTSYISLSQIDYSRSKSGNIILAGSKIEDLGRYYTYFYQNNNFFTDYFDVFEMSGKVHFNKLKSAVLARSKSENYFTYKVDTVYPFEKAKIVAKQLGSKKDQIQMNYSYDNKFWKEIPYKQDKNDSQLFDFVIDDNFEKKSVLFVKIGYGAEKSSQQSDFGLSEFKVDAIMLK